MASVSFPSSWAAPARFQETTKDINKILGKRNIWTLGENKSPSPPLRPNINRVCGVGPWFHMGPSPLGPGARGEWGRHLQRIVTCGPLPSRPSGPGGPEHRPWPLLEYRGGVEIWFAPHVLHITSERFLRFSLSPLLYFHIVYTLFQCCLHIVSVLFLHEFHTISTSFSLNFP